MRLKEQNNSLISAPNKSPDSKFNIIIIDDDSVLSNQLAVKLKATGYNVDFFNHPLEGIDAILGGAYDLLVLDYLMEPISGDEVVKQIREFNNELYILLLTGYKGLGKPINTIREYDIQGYCEKSLDIDDTLLAIESGLKSIEQRRTIKLFKDGLSTILNSVHKMYSLIPLSDILQEILIDLTSFTGCKNAFILVDDNGIFSNDKNVILKGMGVYDVNTDDFSEKLAPLVMEVIGQARTTKAFSQNNMGIAFPLVNDSNEVLGVVYLEGDNFTKQIQLIEIFISQASSAINSAFLHSIVNMQNEKLNKSYEELKNHYVDTIQALRRSVDAKDFYTRGHSDRVAYYASCIAKSFALSDSEIKAVSEAGIFHDIGKIGTDDAILKKNSRLDNDEYSIIKEHPKRGAYILSAVTMFQDVVPLVRSHHERIDGKGYPDGLKGEQIPFLARILCIADAFDAMTSNRQYRSSIGLQNAIKQLQQGKDTQFDSVIVDRFIELLDEFELMQKELAWTYDDELLLEYC